MVAYHDRDWGVPVVALFELLTLESAQAGLSWSRILKKRGFRFVGATICYAAR